MRIDDIWWNQLSNPILLLDDVTDCLLDNQSVVVVYHNDLPWRETLMEALDRKIEPYSSNMSIKHHTLTDTQDPGEFLLEKCCSQEIQQKYWPTDSKALFLAEHEAVVLNNSYVVIDLAGNSDKWISFIKEYTACFKAEDRHGLFILFTQDKKYLESSRKTSDETDNTSPVQFLDYTSYIHDYDTYLLCMTILSQKGLSMQQQQYLSEIAIALAGESTQLAGELADRGEALAEHTLPVFQETLQTLKLPVERIDQRVQYALWQAQLKVFFPLLEQFRRQLFETYRTDITERFHAAPSGTYDCEKPEELEIGQLLFLFKQTRILSMRDYELLQSAKEARNCLAHLNHLSYPKLKVWLSMNFRQQN